MLKRTRIIFFSIFIFVFIFFMSIIQARSFEYKDYTKGLKIPDIVAKVNGIGVKSEYIIFKFNRVMNRLDFQFSNRPDADQLREKVFVYDEKKKVIVDLIDKEIVRELLYQQAKKQNRIPDPKAVRSALNELKKAYKSQVAFDQELAQRGLTEESLNFNLGIDYLIQQLIQETIKTKIDLKDEDVKVFYEKHQDRFQRPEAFRVRHIFIPHFTKEMIQEIPKDQLQEKQKELSEQANIKIKQILEELRAGADFSEMARKFSQDKGSAAKDGDLEFIYKGVFPKAFDEAVSQLKLNEISNVVRTPFGYHVIKLLETKPPENAPFADLEDSIRKHLLVREGQKKLQAFVNNLRKDAEVEMLY